MGLRIRLQILEPIDSGHHVKLKGKLNDSSQVDINFLSNFMVRAVIAGYSTKIFPVPSLHIMLIHISLEVMAKQSLQ
jgi:hypothetical protein